MVIRTEPTNENVPLRCYIRRCEKATQISRKFQLKKFSIIDHFNAKIKIQRAIHSGRVLDATRVGPKELINYKQLTVRYQREHWTGQGSGEGTSDVGAVRSCR